MADETDSDTIAAAILPWVTMPNSSTGPTNGKSWTPDENTAYDVGGGWTEGTDAARVVRARAIAADVLAALPGLGYVHVGAVEYEWAVRVDGGPMNGQVLWQGAEIIARDTVKRIRSGTGVLLRRPVTRGDWEEVPCG